MEVKDAADFIPYDHIGADHAVTSYGDIVFAFQCQMAEAYTMAEVISNEDGEIIGKEPSRVAYFYHQWKIALSQLPDDVVVQKYNFVYTLPYEPGDDSSMSLTRKWNEERYSKRDIVLDRCYIVVTFKGPNSIIESKTKSLKKRIEKFKDIDFSIRDSREKFVDFHRYLNQQFDKIMPLSGQDILSLMMDVWNNELESGDRLSDVHIQPSGLSVSSDYISILTSRRKTEKIDGFTSGSRGLIPSEEFGNNTDYNRDVNLGCSYLFPIGIGAPVDHILIETIVLPNKDDVEMMLTKEHKQLNPLKAMKDRDAANKQEIIDVFKATKSDYKYRYAKWGCCVFVKGRNEEQSKVYAKKLREVAISSMGLYMEIENFGTWKQFFYNLPGLGKKLDNLRVDYLETVSYLTQIETFKRGNSDGIVLVDLFGKPFKQYFWKDKNLEAVNAVVFGPTGQGKSVLVNHILDQCHNDGDVIYVVDVGGSYKRVTGLNQGEYIDSTRIESMSFNPFLDCYQKEGKFYPEMDSKGDIDTIYMDFMVSLFIGCWYKAQRPEKEVPVILRDWIKEYFAEVNAEKIEKVNFDSFYKFCIGKQLNDMERKYIEIDSFKLVMKNFSAEGDYSFLLNAEKTMDVSNRWVAFDLKGVSSNADLITPVILIVMQLFQVKLAEHGKTKKVRFWIDEAIDFLKNPIMADYIGSAYRKIRKEGGQIAIITQSVDYLDNLPEDTKSYILSNTDIKILLNHIGREHLFPAIKRSLSFSDDEMELLKNQSPVDGSRYRIPFIKYGKQPGYLARIEISKETWSLYQTNPKDMKLIDELIDRYNGNYEMAVKEFLKTS